MPDHHQTARSRPDSDSCQFPPAAVIGPDGDPQADSYVIESGLVAMSISLHRTPPTCVGLLGPGSLLHFDPGVGGAQPNYRTVGPTTVAAIPASLLREAMLRQPAVKDAYVEQLRERLAQAELFAACNAHHTLAHRCARWLLRFSAYTGEIVPATHGFLAEVLGVRRAGVSVTLRALQREGAIRQRRGCVVVLDAARLAASACACPNALIRPDSVLSAASIRRGAAVNQGPRTWIEREIRARAPVSVAEDGEYRRRAAALLVCQNIIARGTAFLEAS
jgi:CRP-like cAMP-binding protein